MKTASSRYQANTEARWYAHRWPWFLMLGPLLAMLAAIPTAWVAFSKQDALVVDDYYKEGKAINQDLRRLRAARSLQVDVQLRYDAAKGALTGTIFSLGQPHREKVHIKLIHSTRPDKDIVLEAQPDTGGNFSVALPMLDMARWQVIVEGAGRDWRLDDVWLWPQQRRIDLKAGSEPAAE